jgi:NitT/TauT family transport system permease protein
VLLPKMGALAIVLGLWEALFLVRVWPDYVLPAPLTVLGALGELLRSGEFYQGLWITLVRAATGYTLAMVVGITVGVGVSAVPPLRSAVGSLITSLQTMPSIAWFPLALVLFKIGETAILFVVVIGAAPSIANGIITGIDLVPRQLVQGGRLLGARSLFLYRRVILPAALPALLGGMKQGWAFAWRSLLAGELLVTVKGRVSLGVQLQTSRDLSDYATMISILVVLLVIGLLVDGAFGLVDRGIRRRRGLLLTPA